MPRNLRFNSVPCWRLRPDECVQRDNCQWLPGVDDYFAAFKYTCHTIDVSAKFCQAIENQDVCGNLKECTFVDGGCYHRQDHLPVSRASSDEPPCADLILHDECILRGDDCQWLPAVSAYFGYEGSLGLVNNGFSGTKCHTIEVNEEFCEAIQINDSSEDGTGTAIGACRGLKDCAYERDEWPNSQQTRCKLKSFFD
eukprot:405_1